MDKLKKHIGAAFLAAMCLAGPPVASTLASEIIIAHSSKNAGQLDPHVSTKTQDKIVFAMMFNGLVRFPNGSINPSNVEPDLAKSWESSSDGKIWTFKLNEGVQFHGGYGEFTADDVVYSFARAGDPSRSGVSSDYASFQSVEALDPYTVRITLKHPVPSLLGLVANYHGGNIVSKKAGEEMGDDFKRHPIGTGPFAFEKLEDGQLLRMTAHQDYFKGTPKIEAITYRYIPSSGARDLAFQSGALHAYSGVREDRWVKKMRAAGGSEVDVFEPGELRTLHLNPTIAPFDNLKVRQAIAHAINRDELVAFMGTEVARTNNAPVPIGYLGHAENVAGYAFDQDKAKALLAEAGYPDGFKTTVIITQSEALLSPMQIIQAQLKKVGVEVELQVVEHSTFHKMIRDDASSMVLYGAARIPVADTYLTQFYHSDSTVKTPKAVTNFSHCDVADEEITVARSEANSERQLELWAIAQQKIVDNVCSVPLFELLQVWARVPELDLGYELSSSISLGPVITEKSILKQ